MKISPQLQKRLIVSYILLLLLGFFYVRSVISEDVVDVDDKKEKVDTREVHPAKVFIRINADKVYSTRLETIDTVLDALEELRRRQNFIYEKTAYTYGTELNIIDNQKAPVGYRWNVYDNDKLITFDIHNIYLEDEKTYDIRLEKVE